MVGDRTRTGYGALAVTVVALWVAVLALPCGAHGEAPGQVAPDFDLLGADGSAHKLSDYSGKVILISFWASWCVECIAEMPALESLHERFADKEVVILGISIDRDEEAMRGVLSRFPASYPILRDTTGEVFIDRYAVTSLPTTLLVDRRGIIRDRIEGGIDLASKEFARKLDDLLAER